MLGVSPLSFTNGLGKSYKEDYLKRRTGDYIYFGNCFKIKLCCDRIKINSAIRWFCLKETYIAYLDTDKGYELCFPILIDMDFQIKKGFKAGSIHGLSIKNSQRSLLIKCKKEDLQAWYESIEKVKNTSAKDFCTQQPYEAFAPIRNNQICKWYVNAGNYMEHALTAIKAAKEEIFITDWWFSPELFLKRPTGDIQYRLDKVLLQKSVNI